MKGTTDNAINDNIVSIYVKDVYFNLIMNYLETLRNIMENFIHIINYRILKIYFAIFKK